MVYWPGGGSDLLLLPPKRHRITASRQARQAIPTTAMTTSTPMLPPRLRAKMENDDELSEVEIPELLPGVKVGSLTRKLTPGWNTDAVVAVGHCVVPIILSLSQ
jgi:hypothetical protein